MNDETPPATLVQKSLSAHATIGLIAGALLYLVCLSGTLTVFYQEWQRLEQIDAPEMATIDPDAVQRGVAAVLKSEAGKAGTTHLYVHMPVDALPRTTITTDHQAMHIDRAGRIVMPEENGWSEFLLALHYQLNIPGIVGMTIVGVLGVMLLALSLSGVIAHPRIFRDAFRLRARDTGGLGLADWHNRMGVWTLPFTIAIAATGAMIGLGVVNTYGLATSFYKGDTTAAYAPIFGAEAKPDARRAPLADVATPLRYMQAHFPGIEPSYVILHDPMTAGQHVQIIGVHPRRLIYGESYAFGAEGRYQGKAGMSDGEIGQQLAASTYNLHFGNYGGLPVKIAYFVFGLAVTAISATGVSIWLGKRERRGITAPRLRSAWNAVVWGVPVALALTFLARIVLGNGAPLIAIFWIATTLMIAAALFTPPSFAMKPWFQKGLVATLAVATGLSALPLL